MEIIEAVQKGIEHVKTERGSCYYYLPDGRTQRFKKVEGRWYEPQDLLVYVPTRDFLINNGHNESFVKQNHDETGYLNLIKSYLGRRTSKKNICIVDRNGMLVKHSKSLSEISSVFALFCSGSEVDFYVPVAKNPRLDFYPFDRNHYGNGNSLSAQSHLGHKVVKIVFRDRNL
ncbi:MAG: hypothetical protein AABX31_05045 [Nanoarchaeota archaeon]